MPEKVRTCEDEGGQSPSASEASSQGALMTKEQTRRSQNQRGRGCEEAVIAPQLQRLHHAHAASADDAGSSVSLSKLDGAQILLEGVESMSEWVDGPHAGGRTGVEATLLV
jgi:hypothetical protein